MSKERLRDRYPVARFLRPDRDRIIPYTTKTGMPHAKHAASLFLLKVALVSELPESHRYFPYLFHDKIEIVRIYSIECSFKRTFFRFLAVEDVRYALPV